MREKKILFLVNHDVVIYNFRKELVTRLIDEGYSVYISSPYGNRIDKLIALGAHYLEVDFDRHGKNIKNDLRLLRYYNNIIKEIQPEAVLTFTIKPNVYGAFASRLQKVKCIVNITGLGTFVKNENSFKKIIHFLYKVAFKRVDKVFFQNEDNLNYFMENKLLISNWGLLPGSGVNISDFKLIKYPDQDMTINFLFIARIMKDKGIDEYLDAAKIISIKYPNTKFHICGFCEEDYESKLETLHRDGVIIYHGMVDDVKEFIAKSHATVLPSYHEGTSNVLLESAACGRPIIASNVPGCMETFDEGKSGLGFEVKSSESLIKTLETFINMPMHEKKRMGINGRLKMVEEFNREIVIDEYLKEIREYDNYENI